MHDRVLQLDGRGGRRRRPVEDRERGVALATGLDQPSAPRRDDLFDELVVSRERHRHGAGVSLPCGRRPLDIGQQERHSARHRRKMLCDRHFKRAVLGHDRGLEPPELRSGVDPQFLGQQ